MDLKDVALCVAGVIGSAVAVVHGILVQRLMVARLDPLLRVEQRMADPIKRLVPLLLHFSTFNWLVGGVALVAASIWLGSEARVVTGVLVGSSYVFGALGNLWGTRGRHPGWVLYAIALGLIGFGLC